MPVNHVHGVLIECEPAVREMILKIQEQEGARFIIDSELGTRHLFVSEEWVEVIREKLDDMLEKHTYKVVDKDID